jgi:hypothetical protein
MKITNKLNLPLPILEAVKNKQYDPGQSDITVTSVIGPVQINALKKRYSEFLEEDVADRIYALQGESVHTILERAAEGLEDQYIVEKRFYVEINGWKLGGQIDIFDIEHGILQDYKVTSVYSVKNGPKEEYVKQANINSYLIRHGYYIDEAGQRVSPNLPVRGMQIVAILRDWRKGEYQREEADAKSRGFSTKYPSQQVVVLPIPVVPDEVIEEYIVERVKANQEALKLSDKALPECSPEDRWAKPDSWAVMQAGKKRAVRVFTSEEEAEEFAESSDKTDTYVQHRPGVSTRCELYCPVKKYCQQYKKMNPEEK